MSARIRHNMFYPSYSYHALHLAQIPFREVIISADSLAHRLISVALLGLLDRNARLLVQLLHHHNRSIGLQRRHQLGAQVSVRTSNLREGKYATARPERTGLICHTGARSSKPEGTQFREVPERNFTLVLCGLHHSRKAIKLSGTDNVGHVEDHIVVVELATVDKLCLLFVEILLTDVALGKRNSIVSLSQKSVSDSDR